VEKLKEKDDTGDLAVEGVGVGVGDINEMDLKEAGIVRLRIETGGVFL
jgi:hypothetical protein